MVEGLAEEPSRVVERKPAAFEMGHVELEDVMHVFPDFELDRHARVRCTFGILPGVIEQKFVLPHLNQERRQAMQIAKKG